MKANNIQDIWLFPKRGAIPNLSAIIAAQDVAAMTDQFELFFAAHMAAIERSTQQTAIRLEAMEQDLAAKGVKFNATAMLTPSFRERVQMLMDDAVDWVQEKCSSSSGKDAGGESWPSMSLPIAQTYPTDEIDAEYDDLFAETARFRCAIAEEIAKDRDVVVQKIFLPDDALDFIDDSDEWGEAEQMLCDISDITDIVPPTGGKPGFALSERQEDGGLPIEIELLILTERNYEKLCDSVVATGGRLC